MPANPLANQYRQTAIKTANRGQVLIMLYEGAIQHLRRAIDCLDKKDLAGKGTYICKAHDIINELSTSLNFEIGGDIARELERLYGFMITQLINANLQNKKEPIQTVIKLLDNLLEAWRVAVSQAQKEGKL